MRVALFANELPVGPATRSQRRGGVAEHARRLAEALAARGHEVRLVGAAPSSGRYDIDGVEVTAYATTIQVASTGISFGLWRKAPRDLPAVDVVVCLMGTQPAPLAARRAAAIQKIPFVVIKLGEWKGGFGGPLRRTAVAWQNRYLARSILHAADAIIAPSQAMAAVPVLADVQSKVSIIANGVHPPAMEVKLSRDDARKAYGLPAEAFVFSFLGALTPIKGLDVVISALQHVPDVHVVAMGDGIAMPDLKRQAMAAQVDDRIRFVGHMADDKADLLAATDAFLLPSRTEAFPLVALEAAWQGLPIIASDIPPLVGLRDGGMAAHLFPSEDEIGLAGAMDGLVRDPASRKRMGEQNATWAKRHTWAEAAGQMERLLARVVGGSDGH